MMFSKYAKIYDLFNKNKNYKKEINYLLKLIKSLNLKNLKDLLDVGCGTGLHAAYLKKKKFNVCGVDISNEMLRIAKKKNPKIVFKNINSKLNKQFQICYSFFHVVSYLNTDKKYIDLTSYNYSPQFYKTHLLNVLKQEYELPYINKRVSWLKHEKINPEFTDAIIIHDTKFYKTTDYRYLLDKYKCIFVTNDIIEYRRILW